MSAIDQSKSRNVKISGMGIDFDNNAAPDFAEQRSHQTQHLLSSMGKVQLSPEESDEHLFWVIRDLTLFDWALSIELRALKLSEGEASLIVDVCNGTLFDALSVAYLWLEVADAIELHNVDEKWGVDGEALVAKLKSLSYTQCLAVVEAVERFWNLPKRSDVLADNLKAVGLLRS